MAVGNVLIPNEAEAKQWNGVRLDVEPFKLADEDLALSPNMVPSRPGRISLRPNVETFAELRTSGTVQDAVLMPYVDPAGKARCVIWTTDGVDHYVGFVEPPVDQLIQLTPYLYSTRGERRPAWAVWLNKLWVFSNSAARGFVFGARTGNNLDVTAVNTLWTVNAPTPVGAWIYRSVLMMIERDGLIRNCEVKDPNVLVDLNKSFPVGQGDGDEGIGGAEVAVEGGDSALEPYSIVFKRRSTWMLQGAPPTTTDIGSLKLTALLPKVGCVAKETIAKTPHGIMWCSGESVYLVQPGKVPQDVGRAIGPLLKNCPQGGNAMWSAYFHDGFYRLSIPKFSHGTPPSANGVTFAEREEWWLDMRQFPDALTWWGPQQVPTLSGASLAQLDGTEQLYVSTLHEASGLVSAYLARGDVLRQGRKDKVHDYDAAPDASLHLKTFDFGDPMLKKIVGGVEVNCHVQLPETLTVELIGDGGSTVMSSSNEVLPHPGGTLG